MTVEKVRAIRTEGLIGVMVTLDYEALHSRLHAIQTRELLLMQDAGNTANDEACFCAVIEVARRQGGRSLEVRATVSLAPLLRDTSRRDEARGMLEEIYNWFTEGFDTADLKDAKALLEELNQ